MTVALLSCSKTSLSWAFFGILWSQRRKFEGAPGVVFGASLVLLGVERFIAEFWRITPRVLGWMSAAQLFSIGAFIFGIVLILWMFTHPRAVEGEVREPRQRDRGA